MHACLSWNCSWCEHDVGLETWIFCLFYDDGVHEIENENETCAIFWFWKIWRIWTSNSVSWKKLPVQTEGFAVLVEEGELSVSLKPGRRQPEDWLEENSLVHTVGVLETFGS